VVKHRDFSLCRPTRHLDFLIKMAAMLEKEIPEAPQALKVALGSARGHIKGQEDTLSISVSRRSPGFSSSRARIRKRVKVLRTLASNRLVYFKIP
jgi:hypothetical protein